MPYVSKERRKQVCGSEDEVSSLGNRYKMPRRCVVRLKPKRVNQILSRVVAVPGNESAGICKEFADVHEAEW